MDLKNFSNVEKKFLEIAGQKTMNSNIPYVTVDNFPKLGFFTALRFLEWAAENPNGVISLPTGKTPEFFIKWTQFIINNWDSEKVNDIKKNYGLKLEKKPVLNGLHFVQIDEFYPIDSSQKNSFYDYVNNYYIDGFGLDPKNALLINNNEIELAEGKTMQQVFPEGKVDLSLRYRAAKTGLEKLQQQSIFKIDDWCNTYEQKIREKGGIGFFLGGIGPDGHIAFNVRGSDHYSTTRLTETNFETQAVAAGDLGGIEIARNRLVITIGLGTITYDPKAVAIIFAAGEAKADMVKDALERESSVLYPASVLQNLPNARFYITKGAAAFLEDSKLRYYQTGEWTQSKIERAIIELCQKLDKYGHHLTLDDLKSDPYTSLIPNVGLNSVESVTASIIAKMDKGLVSEKDQVYYHTGPHHDDVMLGILPHVNRQLRDESNEAQFSVLTSGFTAVTNLFISDALRETKGFIDEGLIQMIDYPDFFESGYKHKWDKDVYHYLNKVASGEPSQRRRGLAHRLVRAVVHIWEVEDKEELRNTINEILSILRRSYDGQKNPPKIQKLKGMVRELEEELVWAHFGVQVKNVHHLRLGFYTGDVFTEQPNRERDVKPILAQLKQFKPTVLSLALDPEGSGPDTHYKVLQAIADAVRIWGETEDLSNLRIWGYRNVWYRFHPAEADVIVPVSLNSMDILERSFEDCYLSQVEASFPSYMHDGQFSELAKRIWVEQLDAIQLLLGKDHFYTNKHPKVRSSHGLLFFREMSVNEFLNEARALEKSMEGMV